MAFLLETRHSAAFAAALALVACSVARTQVPAPPAVTGERAAAVPAEVPAERSPLPEGAIDAAVQDAIASQSLPGAVIVIGRHDRVLFRRAYGFREVEPDRVPMTIDTVFDLASLTKPIATATSIMTLVERGKIGLDDPLVRYVPECDREGKRAITLRHLLLHVSGLPADIAKDDFAHGRDEAIRHICETPLRGTPGSVSIYSDLGFMLLEEVVRRVTGHELSAYASETIFTPLGMVDTRFLPTDAQRQRTAWTEFVEGAWRVGVVHDPRAYLLGGVAGHAGLFSTGDDLALYARMILSGGEVDGRRILSRATVESMLAPHDVPGSIRALGWSIENRWRGEGLSPIAVGHFGFTGTALWIDPDKDLFIIVLSNRVHPDGKGDSKPLVARVNTLAAAAIGPSDGRVEGCPVASDGVRTGIDVLRDENFERLRGKRVGLITNASGRARDGTSTIDLLMSAPGVKLVALFSPEHGLNATDNGKVADGHDERTGLPVYSLYGTAFAPTAESLAGIDTLVFDIQDVGTRFFTYASTMRRAMVTAREHDLNFMVLDRPNPIDGIDVAGPVTVPMPSFVNYHSLPIRHGMTLGELATLLNADDHLGVALSVVTMRGWRREAYGDQTGLRWVNPSPNLRSVKEALLYPALGLLESTNVSVGRGTNAPFERIGAPWIDGGALAAALAEDGLEGVEFVPEVFTPSSDRYKGQPCEGVHAIVRDRSRFEPVRTGLAIARELRHLYRKQWEFEKVDRLLIHPAAMRAIDSYLSLGSIVETYRVELASFVAKRQKYLLYSAGDCAPSDRRTE